MHCDSRASRSSPLREVQNSSGGMICTGRHMLAELQPEMIDRAGVAIKIKILPLCTPALSAGEPSGHRMTARRRRGAWPAPHRCSFRVARFSQVDSDFRSPNGHSSGSPCRRALGFPSSHAWLSRQNRCTDWISSILRTYRISPPKQVRLPVARRLAVGASRSAVCHNERTAGGFLPSGSSTFEVSDVERPV